MATAFTVKILLQCLRSGCNYEGDRAAYRRAPGAGETDKAGAAGPGSAPMEFR